MKRFAFEKWIVEVDINKTQRFYEQQFLAEKTCKCLYCRNYYRASKSFSKRINDFFNSFGLESDKVVEVYELGQNEDGTYLYGGIYHVVGNLISSNDIDKYLPKSSLSLESLTEDFKFGFTKHLTLVPKGFPQPVLQLEINTNVPWVLTEKLDEN